MNYNKKTHPMKADLQRQLSTDHRNISHIILKPYWAGHNLKAIVEAANTACGADFDGLIRQGCQVAFSLRAVGPVVEQKKNYVVVKKPLTMYTYDNVVHPSHAVAYMDHIISESTSPMSKTSNKLIAESTNLVPILSEEVADFISLDDENVKLICEQLSVDLKNTTMTLSENKKMVYLREENNDTIAVKLNDLISYEISNYLSKF